MFGKFYSLLLLSIVIMSCSESHLDKVQLEEYVQAEKNGLVKTESLNTKLVEVKYKPSDLIVAQKLKSFDNISKHIIDSLKASYDSLLYFTLNFSDNGQELYVQNANTGGYGKAIEQLSFEMGHFIKIITSKNDTVHVLDYTYPRMYGTTGTTGFLIVFRKDKIKNSNFFDFLIEDFGFFNEDKKLRFKTKDIQNSPSLIINASHV